ncbi:hypothetical protein [Heyndrickxia coagulans]|uniref:hypothetical protein n=1 Tax=Heyndrickxia coagulans TaxID=1398 RepID=UPI0018A713FF|nr:hypothetical protein [Heyndrickxia coagulans]MBF8418953.1 hypothetical protein [Heyndrickxia coagulans]
MKIFRKKLTANTEEIFNINSHYVTVLNIGEGNVFVNFDDTATTDSLIIPAGMGRSFSFQRAVQSVHLISDGTPTVQIDDMT